jgi:hypothetical protein
MEEEFKESTYREIGQSLGSGSIIKKDDAKIIGKTKISVDEDGDDGIKVIIKKDANNNIQEIKFVCTCGQTKTILLDYNE